MQLYIKGNWTEARAQFEQTLTMNKDRNDQPSKTILGYLEQYKFVAPKDWQGVKKLYSK